MGEQTAKGIDLISKKRKFQNFVILKKRKIFQNFDAKMVKIVTQLCFFVKKTSKNIFFLYWAQAAGRDTLDVSRVEDVHARASITPVGVELVLHNLVAAVHGGGGVITPKQHCPIVTNRLLTQEQVILIEIGQQMAEILIQRSISTDLHDGVRQLVRETLEGDRFGFRVIRGDLMNSNFLMKFWKSDQNWYDFDDFEQNFMDFWQDNFIRHFS